MQTLHLDLKPVDENYVELRYFIDNPNKYERRSLPLSEIADLIKLAERDYYVSFFPEDYTITGRRLYNWLDGSDRWLQPLLDKHRGEGIVLAIATSEKLAHLPWEVLHDSNGFLVQRVPAIVPVRWVSDSTVKKLTIAGEPENRALQVLFMATSPLNVEPVLDFEGEEARILETTKRQPLALTVEESGCLSELGYLVDGYDGDYFDVLHLTGHATLQDGQPRFITETATGEAFYASAGDIAQELQFRLPKLIFLSGCRTGQAGNGGSVPSMAEELLKSGAKAVLGWGQKVLDPDATAAASALYQELSAGKQITEALACTYQTLIKNKARDWHLLRLYAAGNLPSSLVTTLRTRGRKPAPPLSVSTQFLDAAGKVKVPTRESFVGRRRQLQNCLRVLSQSTHEVGVLIHGMGGLGKSSLAARLCDRLPNFERVVWVGRIDEASLVSRLTEKLDDNEQRKRLQNYDEDLKYRLKRVFKDLHEEAKPFLLVLDDFEVNLEPRNESYVLQSEAAEVMKALVWAIRENFTSHRIIITSRYDFEFTQLQHFHKQPLEGMRGADLRKKCNLLTAFGAESQVDEALKSQAHKLADGNPRLLEWLDKILQNTTVDVAVILNRLAADPVELREQVLAEALLQQMDTTMREMLSRGLVFELPVPKEAFVTACDTIPNLEHYISRAVALGLLEVSHDETLRVPRILPVQLVEDGEAFYKQAAEVLSRLWGEGTKTVIEEQWLEIHRLALQGKVDKIAVEIAGKLARGWKSKSRFREAVQLCKSTLELAEDYLVLHELARSEQELGDVNQAQEHYQQALDICPAEDEGEKSAIIHNLISLKANKGEIEEAIAFYEQSLALSQQIGDVQAWTLNNLGMLKANKGEIEQAIAFYQQSLALTQQIGDVQGQATTLNNLGGLKANTGEIEQAIAFYQKSLALAEQIGDIQGQATTLNNLGALKVNKGEIEEAIAFYQKSLVITEQIGDVKTTSRTLNNLGHLKANTGEIEQAIVFYQQSLALTEQIGNVQGQAQTLNNLGGLKANRGEIEQAIAFYQQSLALTEQIDDVQLKARTLNNLGLLKANRGEIEQAIAFYQQSLAFTEQIDDIQGQVRILNNLGLLKANRGEIEQAIAFYQQSLALNEQIGDVQGQAATLNNLGGIKANTGEIEQAIIFYQQSLALTEQIGDIRLKARTLNNLGLLKANRGEIEQAIILFEQSLVLTEQIGDVQTTAATLSNLGGIKADREEIEQAITLFKQSLVLTEQIGDVQGQATMLNNLGLLKANKGEIEQAIDFYEKSLALNQQIGNVQGQAQTLNNLGLLKANKGEIEQAIDFYEKSLALNKQIGDVQTTATTLSNLGGIKADRGEIDEAIALFEQSLALDEQIGNVYGQALSLSNLGRMAEKQDNYNQALNYLQPALEILQHIKSPYAEGVRQMVERVQDLIRNS
ncbi:tetratricopeptide repeat protein [Nostoc sp. LEGE 12447]|uniref:tetratricopeptide repeat protein n=1 Tax=Nostoc sp. LEGE 12447 TaxID=1828640 RepID=UPI001880D79D|nr:tetratricopeptide repeat protein [Nostoc sp. LEGE 12447]MBE8997276.1 tetratricopeptide repeat protein [Nostoc sp. LEGE 12447]